MKTWALLSFTACGFGLLLCGCGSSAKPTPVAPAGNALAGNWLLVGPMPTNGLVLGTGFRLALTFDVNGSNVTAAGFGNDSCGNAESSFGFGNLATGTIAADGSFVLQTPANFPEGTMSIQGTVPKASDSSWTGSYLISFDAPIVPPTCDKSLTGTFTATPFPPVSGVYVGTGSTETFANGKSTTTPVTFQVSLQQGGMLTNLVNGATSPLFSNLVLTGSIHVQGSPCFSSGATAVTPASSVEGNMVHAAFLMDDGSTLNLLGSLTDVTEGHIATNLPLVTGGKCGGITTVIQLPGLDRQSLTN
jgi:hypothetical protein